MSVSHTAFAASYDLKGENMSLYRVQGLLLLP